MRSARGTLACMTSGNIGSAMAAAAALAGLPAVVFLLASGGLTEGEAGVNLEKLGQMRAYGATVLCPEASMLTLTRLAATLTAELGWTWMHDLPAYQAEGDKTTAFEIAEQLGWDAPDYVCVPTGTGTNLFGIWKGFDELRRLGFTARVPRIYRGTAGRRRPAGPSPRAWGRGHVPARRGPAERRAPHHSPGHRIPRARRRPEEPGDGNRRDRRRSGRRSSTSAGGRGSTASRPRPPPWPARGRSPRWEPSMPGAASCASSRATVSRTAAPSAAGSACRCPSTRRWRRSGGPQAAGPAQGLRVLSRVGALAGCPQRVLVEVVPRKRSMDIRLRSGALDPSRMRSASARPTEAEMERPPTLQAEAM